MASAREDGVDEVEYTPEVRAWRRFHASQEKERQWIIDVLRDFERRTPRRTGPDNGTPPPRQRRLDTAAAGSASASPSSRRVDAANSPPTRSSNRRPRPRSTTQTSPRRDLPLPRAALPWCAEGEEDEKEQEERTQARAFQARSSRTSPTNGLIWRGERDAGERDAGGGGGGGAQEAFGSPVHSGTATGGLSSPSYCTSPVDVRGAAGTAETLGLNSPPLGLSRDEGEGEGRDDNEDESPARPRAFWRADWHGSASSSCCSRSPARTDAVRLCSADGALGDRVRPSSAQGGGTRRPPELPSEGGSGATDGGGGDGGRRRPGAPLEWGGGSPCRGIGGNNTAGRATMREDAVGEEEEGTSNVGYGRRNRVDCIAGVGGTVADGVGSGNRVGLTTTSSSSSSSVSAAGFAILTAVAIAAFVAGSMLSPASRQRGPLPSAAPREYEPRPPTTASLSEKPASSSAAPSSTKTAGWRHFPVGERGRLRVRDTLEDRGTGIDLASAPSLEGSGVAGRVGAAADITEVRAWAVGDDGGRRPEIDARRKYRKGSPLLLGSSAGSTNSRRSWPPRGPVTEPDKQQTQDAATASSPSLLLPPARRDEGETGEGGGRRHGRILGSFESWSRTSSHRDGRTAERGAPHRPSPAPSPATHAHGQRRRPFLDGSGSAASHELFARALGSAENSLLFFSHEKNGHGGRDSWRAASSESAAHAACEAVASGSTATSAAVAGGGGGCDTATVWRNIRGEVVARGSFPFTFAAGKGDTAPYMVSFQGGGNEADAEAKVGDAAAVEAAGRISRETVFAAAAGAGAAGSAATGARKNERTARPSAFSQHGVVGGGNEQEIGGATTTSSSPFRYHYHCDSLVVSGDDFPASWTGRYAIVFLEEQEDPRTDTGMAPDSSPLSETPYYCKETLSSPAVVEGGTAKNWDTGRRPPLGGEQEKEEEVVVEGVGGDDRLGVRKVGNGEVVFSETGLSASSSGDDGPDTVAPSTGLSPAGEDSMADKSETQLKWRSVVEGAGNGDGGSSGSRTELCIYWADVDEGRWVLDDDLRVSNGVLGVTSDAAPMPSAYLSFSRRRRRQMLDDVHHEDGDDEDDDDDAGDGGADEDGHDDGNDDDAGADDDDDADDDDGIGHDDESVWGDRGDGMIGRGVGSEKDGEGGGDAPRGIRGRVLSPYSSWLLDSPRLREWVAAENVVVTCETD